MPCVDKKATTTKTRNKQGRVITKQTHQKVCGDRTEDLTETEGEIHPHVADDARELEGNDADELLEEWEELVFPEALNAKPKEVLVVVRDSRTGEKKTKRVPRWAVDEVPLEEMLKQHLQPDNEIREHFRRFI
jgi:hypothetical protein